ncbi:hypothetical protein L3Y34_016599 [Caenorhabditis briggsae]|uniref:Tyrosine-protein phosphatase domain-containing protein n=1 Tax=Caenorhabditis briggsae TaxID=6238 RepID=A0AAE9J0S4_CAEBR|nr:hypothetical protein L3Y34_016599 [Caenorhabditis briggsae]
MEKKRSKTNLLQKFAEKFKKKKRAKSTSASRERSSEMSRRPSRQHRSPSKGKQTTPSGTPSASAESKSRIDLMEVTAKGVKEKTKEKQRTSDKNKKKKNEKETTIAPSKSPSTPGLRRADSLMELSQNSKVVEKAVRTWLETIGKEDFMKKTLDSEYKSLDAIKVDMDKCQAFKKNIDLCQSENIEVLDANRVKGNGEADFFYHASVLNLAPITTKTTILAQLADLDSPQSLESFWLMVAAQKIQRVYFLTGSDSSDSAELDKSAFATYFPEDFTEFKTIRVNNRKTIQKSEEQLNSQLYYEVVPKDCAEAPFCMIEICDFWPDAKIPAILQSVRIAGTAASVFETDIDADASCAIMSNYGAGRPGSFLVGALAIEKLRNGDVPNIKDIAILVRSQRPGAIETFSQYMSTYIIALYYGQKHVKDGELKSKLSNLISQLETFATSSMKEEEDDDDSAGTTTGSNTCD